MGTLTFGSDKSTKPSENQSNSIVTITNEIVKEVITQVEVPVEIIKEVSVETIKEVVKEVPVEVIKEVIKEVPVEVIKEVIVEKIKAVEVKVVDQELSDKLILAISNNDSIETKNKDLAKKIEELQIANQIINEKVKLQTKIIVLGLICLLGLVLFI